MGKMPTAYLHLFLKGAMSAPIGRVTCSVCLGQEIASFRCK